MPISNSLKGMRSQRTLQTIRKDAEANRENADYLKLFMLEKERTRLRNEMIRINLRSEVVTARLKEIEEFYTATLGIKEELPEEQKKTEEVEPEKKAWKTMPIKY